MKGVEMLDDGMRMEMRDEERDIGGIRGGLYTHSKSCLRMFAAQLQTIFGRPDGQQ